MSTKEIKGRIVLKHDTATNWQTAGDNGFCPLANEIIMFDPDDSCAMIRYKIGRWANSAKTELVNINDLPFEPNIFVEQQLTEEQKQVARENIGASSIGKSGSGINGEIFNDYENSDAAGDYAHAEGWSTEASGDYSHAEGKNTVALANGSHSEGQNTKALKASTHAEGFSTIADKEYSHVEGYQTAAGGYGAHAEGYSNRVFDLLNLQNDYDRILETWLKADVDGKFTYAYGQGAHAEGGNTLAMGDNSHAEGSDSVTEGVYSHVEGRYNYTKGISSHAEGDCTAAIGDYSHAEGTGSASFNPFLDNEEDILEVWRDGDAFICAYGTGSHAEGYDSFAYGYASHAEGEHTFAEGEYSHAEGCRTEAKGYASHAEGEYSIANAGLSHAEGNDTLTDGEGSHAEGGYTHAIGDNSHAEGLSTEAEGIASHAEGEESYAAGQASHAEGFDTEASEDYSHAEGESTWADGEASHAEGQSTMALGLASHSEGISTYTMGEGSHSEGLYSHADENYAHAEGNYCVAYGEASHAEGAYSETHANSAHAEGLFSMAMGQASHTEGRSTIAMGENAHAEGESSNLYDSAFEGAADQQAFHALWKENLCAIAYGQSSHVEGGDCIAYSAYAHAEGNETASMGYATHTEGYGTIAFEDFSHAQGKFNKVTANDQYAHTVGNGESDSKRSNAHTLDWKGNAWFAGDVYVGSTSGKNKDEGSKKLATEEIVDTKVAAMGDTKMNAIENKATSYIIPVIPYNSNQPTTRILAAFASDIYSGRIPYYFNNTTEHLVPSNGWLITATPQYEGDCANKKYVDDNFVSKTGDGIINGNLSITGNLTIQGATYTQENETLRIADNIIEINSNKADNTTVLSGIAINKNSTSTYGIMYDPASDTVKLGEGATNAGVFSFNEGEGAPLAIRDDSNNIDDGAIMIFDKSKNRLVNSGYTIDTFKQWVRDYVESYMSTTTTVDADGGETIEMTVADNLISEKDGILEIGG